MAEEKEEEETLVLDDAEDVPDDFEEGASSSAAHRARLCSPRLVGCAFFAGGLGSLLTAVLCWALFLYLPALPTPGAASPAPAAPHVPYSSPYSSLYLSALPACSTSNWVLQMQRDGYHPFETTPSERRPWSLSPTSLPSPTSPPLCSTSDDLLAAMHLGQRRIRPTPSDSSSTLLLSNASGPPSGVCERMNGSIPVDVELVCQSDFVPHGCQVGWLSARESCELMGEWSGLYLVGDSLSRHMAQAVLMLLTQDLQWGGLPRGEPMGALFQWCQCDGQFASAALCRDWDINRFMRHHDVRQYGVCSFSKGWAFEYIYPTEGPNVTVNWLCKDSPRPQAVLLQGGVHLRLDAQAWIDRVVEPTLRGIKETHATCPNQDVYVLLSGMVAQSRHVDGPQPHQSREKAAEFNAVVERYAAEQWGVKWVDFWNLTLNAASTDGLHQLTDGNLLKALAVLRAFDLMRKEGQPTFKANRQQP